MPSNWELHGFGQLNYKKDPTNAWTERGLYEYDFAVPAGWSGKRIFLVFEGVMTDTSAKLNGEPVRPTHQGGFYQFRHEVTRLVKPGATNRLEATVAKHSANESVNKAERLADYFAVNGYASFSPDSRQLAYATIDHTIRLRDLTTRCETSATGVHNWWVYSLCVSPDGRRLAKSWRGEKHTTRHRPGSGSVTNSESFLTSRVSA